MFYSKTSAALQRGMWVFFIATFVLLMLPAVSRAAHCGIPFRSSGYFFDNFEQAEYVNNLLVLHFKLKSFDDGGRPDGRPWTSNTLAFADNCNPGAVQSVFPLLGVAITPGVQLFSIRFTSPTHFEIWNDEANIPEPCANCAQDFPAFPGYYEFLFGGIIDGGASTLSSASYRISNNAPDPPVRGATLPSPPNCPPFQTGGFNNYFFDNYERAEYVNGLLVYHFRLQSPFNDGRTWNAQILLHNPHCNVTGTYPVDFRFSPLVTNIRPYSRYYSVRFSNPTHFDIWNDEINAREDCPGCSVDIPATLPDGQPYQFISIYQDINNSASFSRSTPFPIQETLPPPQRNPVIIVPGILGSWFKNGEWVIDPILHTYDDLIRLLDEAGYTPGENLFTFPYDWTQPISLSDEQLKARIQEIKTICQCTKVDLIAHSLGGLAARSYAQSSGYENDIDQLIFLGAPHEGSSMAYLLWEGGELTPEVFSTNFDRLAELVLNIKAIFSGFGSKFSYIRNNVFSVRDMLPTYDYLEDAAPSSTLRHYPDGYPRNLFLEVLNATSSESRLAERGIRVTNIIGNIEPNFVGSEQIDKTIGTIRVVDDPSQLPKWEHGYPENYNVRGTDHGLEFTEGDGRVPTFSAIHNFPAATINAAEIKLHSRLPTLAWPQISEALFGAVEPEQPTQVAIEDLLIIPVFSPVDIQVIDPLGRKVGKDFATGSEVNQIPLAFYNGTEEEFIIIPNPLNGEYQIKIQGTGSGSYELGTNYISNATSTEQIFAAHTIEGLTADLTFNFATETPEATVLIPADTMPPVTAATASGTPAANGWYISEVSVALDAEDNDGGVGVFKTEYSLDNGASWIAYAAPFAANGEGTTTVAYRSEDFVGNIEATQSLELKIDRTPPEARIFWDANTFDLGIEGIDLASTTVRQPSGDTYEISDEAGHTLLLTFQKIEKKKRVNHVELQQLTYDGGPAILLPHNDLSYAWAVNAKTGELDKLNQKLRIKKQLELTAKFRRKENKTEIKVITHTGDNKKKETQIFSGLRVVKLVTTSGKLDYEL